MLASGTDATLSLFDADTLRRIGTPLTMPAADWTFATYSGVADQIVGLAPAGPAGERRFTFPDDPVAWARTACQVAGTDFTRAEWERLVGDRPYRAVCSP